MIVVEREGMRFMSVPTPCLPGRAQEARLLFHRRPQKKNTKEDFGGQKEEERLWMEEFFIYVYSEVHRYNIYISIELFSLYNNLNTTATKISRHVMC